jgi:hypothetical protein
MQECLEFGEKLFDRRCLAAGCAGRLDGLVTRAFALDRKLVLTPSPFTQNFDELHVTRLSNSVPAYTPV